MRFAVLGSGSKGNALVIDGGGRRVLVDCGYAPREVKRRLAHLDMDMRAVDALLVTHGHGDHVKGARQMAATLGIPTYATQGTQRFCAGSGGLRNVVPIVAGQSFHLGGLQVLPVATPHDAPGSVCFVIHDGAECLGVCTDLGMPTQEVADALRTCNALVLEHNHDPDMLQRGPYSPALKRRIASPRGHLSNADGARLLGAARHVGLTRVLLAHLSEVNNTPELALQAARTVVDGADIELSIAPQHHPTGWLRPHRRQDASMHEVRRAARREPPTVVVSTSSPPEVMPECGAAPNSSPTPLQQRALERQLALFTAPARTPTARP